MSSTVALTACAFLRDRAKISDIDLAKATYLDPRRAGDPVADAS